MRELKRRIEKLEQILIPEPSLRELSSGNSDVVFPERIQVPRGSVDPRGEGDGRGLCLFGDYSERFLIGDLLTG